MAKQLNFRRKNWPESGEVYFCAHLEVRVKGQIQLRVLAFGAGIVPVLELKHYTR